jgi:nitrite reductase/ring-hydroxylating ferredoxin subunit
VLVVTFAATGAGNCVEVADAPYVYARTASGGFVMGAACPHRGGPLHLADVSADGRQVRCPWHGGRVSVARLRRQVASVRRGGSVTAVFSVPPGTPTRVRHVPVAAALCAVGGGGPAC